MLPALRAILTQPLQQIAQLLQAFEIMHRQKVIHIGQGALNATHAPLVILGAEQGIEPDEAMVTELQTVHLMLEQTDVVPVPAVADEQYDGSLTENSPVLLIVEG
jgi:hypothetical protein